jgi:S-DNA-T family DNA segregation ATPase FtsK/SpoIIIE
LFAAWRPKADGHNRSVSLIVSPHFWARIVTMSAASVTSSVTAPLPEKIASLVHEARWLLVGLVGIYLALICGATTAPIRAGPMPQPSTESRIPAGVLVPGWRPAAVPFGPVGLVAGVLPFFLLAWGYHRLSHIFGGDRRSLLIALGGFAVLLLACAGVESCASGA